MHLEQRQIFVALYAYFNNVLRDPLAQPLRGLNFPPTKRSDSKDFIPDDAAFLNVRGTKFVEGGSAIAS